MVGLILEQRGNLLVPPCEFLAGDADISAVVDYIVDLTTERVQCSNRASFFGWQKQKRIVKARTTLGDFVLAIFVRAHG
jgi:hypothetical protein